MGNTWAIEWLIDCGYSNTMIESLFLDPVSLANLPRKLSSLDAHSIATSYTLSMANILSVEHVKLKVLKNTILSTSNLSLT